MTTWTRNLLVDIYKDFKKRFSFWQSFYILIGTDPDENTLLFNIQEDPSESTNLVDDFPEVGLCVLVVHVW